MAEKNLGPVTGLVSDSVDYKVDFVKGVGDTAVRTLKGDFGGAAKAAVNTAVDA